jgi:hypothetical protein
MSETDRCPNFPRCSGDCPVDQCELDAGQPAGADIDLGDDWEPCDHEHTEDCYDWNDDSLDCHHQHCFACGGCNCPGYCDDYVTYNLRPDETGGAS